MMTEQNQTQILSISSQDAAALNFSGEITESNDPFLTKVDDYLERKHQIDMRLMPLNEEIRDITQILKRPKMQRKKLGKHAKSIKLELEEKLSVLNQVAQYVRGDFNDLYTHFIGQPHDLGQVYLQSANHLLGNILHGYNVSLDTPDIALQQLNIFKNTVNFFKQLHESKTNNDESTVDLKHVLALINDITFDTNTNFYGDAERHNIMIPGANALDLIELVINAKKSFQESKPSNNPVINIEHRVVEDMFTFSATNINCKRVTIDDFGDWLFFNNGHTKRDKHSKSSSGLGLSLLEDNIVKYGGSIEIESIYREGKKPFHMYALRTPQQRYKPELNKVKKKHVEDIKNSFAVKVYLPLHSLYSF